MQNMTRRSGSFKLFPGEPAPIRHIAGIVLPSSKKKRDKKWEHTIVKSWAVSATMAQSDIVPPMIKVPVPFFQPVHDHRATSPTERPQKPKFNPIVRKCRAGWFPSWDNDFERASGLPRVLIKWNSLAAAARDNEMNEAMLLSNCLESSCLFLPLYWSHCAGGGKHVGFTDKYRYYTGARGSAKTSHPALMLAVLGPHHISFGTCFLDTAGLKTCPSYLFYWYLCTCLSVVH